MTALDTLVPTPRLLELDEVEVAASPERVWEILRHGELTRSRIARALFAIRTLPDRFAGRPPGPSALRLDDLRSSPARPGFQILAEDPPREVTVGAIGKVWHLDIPFVHVAGAAAYAAFAEAGYVKVAWALRVTPRGESGSRVEIELRVFPTDEPSWTQFSRYFRVIGPASRFIRRTALRRLARKLGDPEQQETLRALPGDELLPDAAAQITHAITIRGKPEAIWPWLVQMGCRRAGYYSYDTLDNGGARSARELHPELASLGVGDVLPATPDGDDGFEVLELRPSRALILGGLFDLAAGEQRPFAAERPPRYWHVSWAFVLESLDAETTRLHVRARAAHSPDARLHALWIRPVHAFMQGAQLRNLAARAEGRLGRDDWRDVAAGIGGVGRIALGFLTPFRRRKRERWGVDAATAARTFPGDPLVSAPRWTWTHAVEIDAPADEVWGWVAQLGADRGGFYSYQWLENLFGCDVRNAERVHPEWELHEGSALSLHPKRPPLTVVEMVRGRYLVAYAAPDQAALSAGRPWIAASWLFWLEPLGLDGCRLVSRYRAASSGDLATRIAFGPALLEPIGFAMDREMLLGIKARAEAAVRALARAREPARLAAAG
jgi:hypothetical protein